jgi:hypothetical protein
MLRKDENASRKEVEEEFTEVRKSDFVKLMIVSQAFFYHEVALLLSCTAESPVLPTRGSATSAQLLNEPFSGTSPGGEHEQHDLDSAGSTLQSKSVEI